MCVQPLFLKSLLTNAEPWYTSDVLPCRIWMCKPTQVAGSERWKKGACQHSKGHWEWGLEGSPTRELGCMGAPDKGKLAPGSCFLADGWMKCYKRQEVNVSQWHTSLCVIRNEIVGNPRTVLTQCGDNCAEQRWLFYVFSHWEALLLNVRFLIKRQSVLFYWQPQWMKPPRGK